ncbi:hypothetical protein DV736_g3068, partial [Chaetothyriales sp. CBS 134916]
MSSSVAPTQKVHDVVKHYRPAK